MKMEKELFKKLKIMRKNLLIKLLVIIWRFKIYQMKIKQIMKHLEKVKNQLNKNGIEFELGTETGWSDNTIIFDGSNEFLGDCKILVYVNDVEGEMVLSYYDLFVKGEYSPIFDCKVKKTTTSHRGNKTSVTEMLDDLEMISIKL